MRRDDEERGEVRHAQPIDAEERPAARSAQRNKNKPRDIEGDHQEVEVEDDAGERGGKCGVYGIAYDLPPLSGLVGMLV